MKARFTITVELEDTTTDAKRYEECKRKEGSTDYVPTIAIQSVVDRMRTQVYMAQAYFERDPCMLIQITVGLPQTIDCVVVP